VVSQWLLTVEAQAHSFLEICSQQSGVFSPVSYHSINVLYSHIIKN
jgi:hypothetical protein